MEFQGKEVPCFVSCTENGSITSVLLATMLKTIDLSGVFTHCPGIPNPLLLCDGHGISFDLTFLEYINDDKHKWYTCIWTLYGTNTSQVGDSEQQNGSFNMEIGRDKMKLLQQKIEAGHKYQITKKDIAWLLCFAWPKSFGSVVTSIL
jgi:hypothetical protein